MSDKGRGKVIKIIRGQIWNLTGWLNIIDKIQLGSLIRIDINCYGTKSYRIAIPRGFNPQSVKCEIIAASKEYRWPKYGKGKEHWESIKYEQVKKISPVNKADLPLYVSEKYTSHLLEEMLKNA